MLVAGCADQRGELPPPRVVELEFDVPKLKTPAQVQHALGNALASDRAVVFVHLDWAVMESQRDRFTRFMLAYHQQFPAHAVGFHYIDCTPISSDYTPLKSLPGWPGSGSEVFAQQGTGGWGDVIWLDHGVVRHVESILESQDATELVAKTRVFLAPRPEGA